jgi:hypothetical protein
VVVSSRLSDTWWTPDSIFFHFNPQICFLFGLEIPIPRAGLRLLTHPLLPEGLFLLFCRQVSLFYLLVEYGFLPSLIVIVDCSSFNFCQDTYFHLDNLQMLQPQMESSILNLPKLFRMELVGSMESIAQRL